jgi:hypothetical protein
MGISEAVQSRGGVLRTSLNTGPYAVRSSNFEVEGAIVVVVVVDILAGLGVANCLGE